MSSNLEEELDRLFRDWDRLSPEERWEIINTMILKFQPQPQLQPKPERNSRYFPLGGRITKLDIQIPNNGISFKWDGLKPYDIQYKKIKKEPEEGS